MRNMDWVQPYEQSMALCRYIDRWQHIDRWQCDPRKVEEHWHHAFNCIAKYLGFNKATRRVLWKDLARGNWEHLHQTEDERRKTASDWLDDLRGECWYCSDRWSLDRLTRCHWTWRQYYWATWKAATDEHY